MWAAAFILGLAGSLHCAGMCSPLVMTVTRFTPHAMVNRVLYNLGRISMYGLMGAVVSLIGMALPISKYQNIISIVLGIFLLMIGVIGITSVRIPLFANVINRFTGFIKNKFTPLINKKKYGSMMLMGALNGLLPCGLTYIALALCVAMPNPVDGFLSMFIFGIGTLPVMLGLVSVLSLFAKRLPLANVSRGLLIVSGLLLVLRVFLFHSTEGHEAHRSLVEIVICR